MTNVGLSYRTAKHSNVAEFVRDEMPLPTTFMLEDKTFVLSDWLTSHWTTGLVVLKIKSPTEAILLHESYYLGNTAETKTISWSVGKSVVSALIGIALSEGKIGSLNDDVCKYAPALKGGGYDGVRIEDVLQMSSGIAFNEDYDKFFSDVNIY